MKKNLTEHSDTKAKDTFQVEGKYFDDLEKSLLARVKKDRFVLDADIPLALTAPEGYFAHLEQDTFDETINIKVAKEPVMKVSYNRNWTTLFRVAAILIAVFGIGWAVISYSSAPTSSEYAGLESIQEEEILAYLEGASIDETLFLEVFNEELDQLQPLKEPIDELDEVSEEDLQFFLNEEGILEI